AFYQYWLNASDEDSENFIKIFTIKGQAEIESLITQHKAAPHQRLLQTELAKDITTRVHGADELNNAIKASQILFGNSVTEDLRLLDEKTLLAVMDGVPRAAIPKSQFEQCATVTDLLSEATGNIIFPS